MRKIGMITKWYLIACLFASTALILGQPGEVSPSQFQEWKDLQSKEIDKLKTKIIKTADQFANSDNLQDTEKALQDMQNFKKEIDAIRNNTNTLESVLSPEQQEAHAPTLIGYEKKMQTICEKLDKIDQELLDIWHNPCNPEQLCALRKKQWLKKMCVEFKLNALQIMYCKYCIFALEQADFFKKQQVIDALQNNVISPPQMLILQEAYIRHCSSLKQR